MDDWSVRILIAAAAGFFTLLAVFLGARLSRQTEHDKWLRQNRSEVFTKFLEFLAKAHEKATDILFDRSLEELAQNIKVTEAYMPAMDYVRIVRLYLPARKRDEFKKLAHGYYVLHSQRSLGDSRLTKMGERLDAIQAIFEDTL